MIRRPAVDAVAGGVLAVLERVDEGAPLAAGEDDHAGDADAIDRRVLAKRSAQEREVLVAHVVVVVDEGDELAGGLIHQPVALGADRALPVIQAVDDLDRPRQGVIDDLPAQLAAEPLEPRAPLDERRDQDAQRRHREAGVRSSRPPATTRMRSIVPRLIAVPLAQP